MTAEPVPPSFRDLAFTVWREAEADGGRLWETASPEERAALVAGRIVHVAGYVDNLARVGYLGADAPARYLRDGEAVDTAVAPPSNGAGPLIGLPLGEFLAHDAGPVPMFGPVVEGSTSALVGRPESFKTFGLLQLGLCGAAGVPWLGVELGEPRPFVYVSAEKSRATIRDRLARLTSSIVPVAPVRIVHRAGVTFGDPKSWGEVRRIVDDLGPRTFVGLDTIASLAGPGFDEISGRDMAVVLAAIRQIGDAGATVAAAHHPSKFGDGTGGIRLRGHTSLWGEVDAVMEFTRPDRSVETGLVRLEPKDGDLRLIAFRWDRETFLLQPEAGILPATAATIASVVEALYDGQPLTADRIRAEFPGHGRTAFMDRLREAVTAGTIARIGGSKTTGYLPIPRVFRADEWDSGPNGRMADEPPETRTNVRSGPGRMADEAPSPYSSAGGGLYDPSRTNGGPDE